MKKLLFGLAVMCSVFAIGQSTQGEIVGKVLDTVENEPLYGVKVWVEVGDTKLFGLSNFEGRYRISAVPSGTYTVYLKYKSDTIQIQNQYVKPDGLLVMQDIEFSNTLMVGPVLISGGPKLIEIGNETMQTILPEDIDKSLNRQDLAAMLESMSSDITRTSSGDMVIRGSRPGEVLYFVDGVKANNISMFPGVSLGGVTIYTGGIPAKYGDTVSGVIILETKSYFDLLRNWKIANFR